MNVTNIMILINLDPSLPYDSFRAKSILIRFIKAFKSLSLLSIDFFKQHRKESHRPFTLKNYRNITDGKQCKQCDNYFKFINASMRIKI